MGKEMETEIATMFNMLVMLLGAFLWFLASALLIYPALEPFDKIKEVWSMLTGDYIIVTLLFAMEFTVPILAYYYYKKDGRVPTWLILLSITVAIVLTWQLIVSRIHLGKLDELSKVLESYG